LFLVKFKCQDQKPHGLSPFLILSISEFAACLTCVSAIARQPLVYDLLGNPKLFANTASVPVMFASLGKPFIMNPIPAMILIGNSPNDINLYIFIM
jgi:hypothetical protein